MIAEYNFTQLIQPHLKQVTRVQVDLYGSLSLTGIGHHTDRATILGLLGNRPDTIKITSANLAMKAINASRMALKRTSKCLISLDKVIDTMYQIGKDMNRKYRETSLGGLALIHMAPPCE